MGKRNILYIVIILILIGVGSFFTYRKAYKQKNDNPSRQAVFTTNGQVYFGYVSNRDKQVVTLKDIYYLRTQDSLQPNDKSSNLKISLIKLGKELHGPEDIMYINRDHILFYEDMRSDSKINEAIQKYSETDQNTVGNK